MDNLLQAINDYYHAEGHYPKVKVEWVFWLKNRWKLEKLYTDYFIDVSVDQDETADQWELE